MRKARGRRQIEPAGKNQETDEMDCNLCNVASNPPAPAVRRRDNYRSMVATDPAWAGVSIVVAADAPPPGDQIETQDMERLAAIIARKRFEQRIPDRMEAAA
jgi:hypothetical protein